MIIFLIELDNREVSIEIHNARIAIISFPVLLRYLYKKIYVVNKNIIIIAKATKNFNFVLKRFLRFAEMEKLSI